MRSTPTEESLRDELDHLSSEWPVGCHDGVSFLLRKAKADVAGLNAPARPISQVTQMPGYWPMGGSSRPGSPPSD